MNRDNPPVTALRRTMSAWAILALAVLPLPRVLLHAFQVSLSRPVDAALTLGPLLAWVLVVGVLTRTVPPVRTLLLVGGICGVAVAVAHNLLWPTFIGRGGFSVGGNLTGTLTPTVQEALLRTAVSLDSVVTGLVVGLITGLLAAGVRRLVTDRSRRTGARS